MLPFLLLEKETSIIISQYAKVENTNLSPGGKTTITTSYALVTSLLIKVLEAMMYI